jgi:hypothetical protein
MAGVMIMAIVIFAATFESLRLHPPPRWWLPVANVTPDTARGRAILVAVMLVVAVLAIKFVS